jgi:hypothetical protein
MRHILADPLKRDKVNLVEPSGDGPGPAGRAPEPPAILWIAPRGLDQGGARVAGPGIAAQGPGH